MKFLKKTAALPVILIFLLFFCSCTKEDKIDYSELCIRMSKSDERFSLPENGVFYSDYVYFIYYSLCAENDVLVTAREDEDKRLNRITVTLLQKNYADSLEAYKSLCLAAAAAFVPDNSYELAAASGITDDAVISSTDLKSRTIGGYSASTVSSEFAVCFILEHTSPADL